MPFLKGSSNHVVRLKRHLTRLVLIFGPGDSGGSIRSARRRAGQWLRVLSQPSWSKIRISAVHRVLAHVKLEQPVLGLPQEAVRGAWSEAQSSGSAQCERGMGLLMQCCRTRLSSLSRSCGYSSMLLSRSSSESSARPYQTSTNSSGWKGQMLLIVITITVVLRLLRCEYHDN